VKVLIFLEVIVGKRKGRSNGRNKEKEDPALKV